MNENSLVESGSLLLIVEEIGDQAKPLGLGIPSLKINKNLEIGVSHKKLQRRVYQAAFELAIYAGSNKLDRMPGLLDWLSQYIQPDKSLTTKRTGKVLGYSLTYYGYANILSLQESLGISSSLTIPFVDLYGTDPASSMLLYGNPAVTFSSAGGSEVLTGAAFFDLKHRVLRNVDTGAKKELFKLLVERS